MNGLFNKRNLRIIPGIVPRIIPSLVLTALSFFGTSHSYAADTYEAQSSKHPVALIELYTSQGCSSCPPADKWLGDLEKSGITNDQAVPLALHVDYWDYIGWKDQFSQKYFTKRQYQYQKTNHSSSVYTPQIMFNGDDVRRVKLNNSLDQLRREISPVSFAVKAVVSDENNLKLAINFDRIDPIAKESNVVVVLAENNLVSNIEAGENAGNTLKHSHVARVWKNLGEIRNEIELDLAVKPAWSRANLEVVVIVENTDMQTQQVLQLPLR